jgi:hypothetical protein
MIEWLRGPELGNISGGITGADVHPEQLETFEGIDVKVVVGAEGNPVEIASRGAENRVFDSGFELCRTLFEAEDAWIDGVGYVGGTIAADSDIVAEAFTCRKGIAALRRSGLQIEGFQRGLGYPEN